MNPSTLNNREFSDFNSGSAYKGGESREQEKDFDNGALYFLSFIVIVILTFSLFKSDILHLFFSYFL